MIERQDIPWGRPPVPGIPVPPFDDAEQSRAFHSALAEHVFCLARAAGRFDPATFALLSILPGAAPGTGLEPWVLRVALSTFFPAPWTPWNLATALNAAALDGYQRWFIEPHRIGYHSDPEFWADRSPDGSWTSYFRERGQLRRDREAASDDDMVLLLTAHVRAHPYPFGWRVRDETRMAALADRAGPTLAAWEQHATWPYIADRLTGD
ncbi:hypothetical protein [Gordonia sp. (in: high G+C Gram-positive bacteria)]|uniref:hypothetical protein n=1 Tax=Gordonia sp. (in: high G+C Gram-positive bacteria) TaxID=84139 RepID=UPI003529C175